MKRQIHIEWDSAFERPLAIRHQLGGAELEEAKAILEAQLAPCGPSFAGQKVARLQAVLAGRTRGETDLRAWASVMLAELGALPEDLVRAACDDWLRSEKWLPTLAELLDRMDLELSKRRRMLAALNRPAHTDEPKPQAPRASARSIGEILAKHKVARPGPKASLVPAVSSGYLSKEQAEANDAPDKMRFWLEQMAKDAAE